MTDCIIPILYYTIPLVKSVKIGKYLHISIEAFRTVLQNIVPNDLSKVLIVSSKYCSARVIK